MHRTRRDRRRSAERVALIGHNPGIPEGETAPREPRGRLLAFDGEGMHDDKTSNQRYRPLQLWSCRPTLAGRRPRSKEGVGNSLYGARRRGTRRKGLAPHLPRTEEQPIRPRTRRRVALQEGDYRAPCPRHRQRGAGRYRAPTDGKRTGGVMDDQGRRSLHLIATTNQGGEEQGRKKGNILYEHAGRDGPE